VLVLIAFHTLIAEGINAALNALYAAMSGAGEASIHATVTPDAVLIFSPIVVAAVLMLIHEEPRRLVEKGVEWWTLVFFMFLFAIASALSYTGVTDKMAYALVQSVGGLTFESTVTLAIMIAVISAVISAFLDNMPVVVALTPVVKTLIEIGLPGGDLLWWALLYGATMGGNMTLIGSTANIVALGILERHGKVVKFWDWFKVGLPAVAITLGVALAILLGHGFLVYSPK
jgi:Na+/H+ antiporter NhaD/arsenite permease-like protein